MSFADLITKKSGAGGCEECDESPESGLPEPSKSGSVAGSLEAFIQRFGHVTESYWFYDHTVELRFNIEEHKYYRVGELGNLIPVNGVTNTVSIKDKSFMLTPWAAKVAIQKLLRLMPTEMIEGVIRIKPLTFEEFTTIALEAKSAHKDKLDEASDIGHAAHKCLEDSINHAMQTDPQKMVRGLVGVPADELAANAAHSGLAWMLQHNVRWQETESKIYSREFDYAGTMDGLAVCDSCDDKACCPVPFKDRLSLIDWKSSNHLNITYLWQVASYKKAKTEEFPAINIEDIWILRLGKSEEEAGRFEPWHLTPNEYEEDFQGFLACLNLTRLADSIEERMKAQKGSIRAIKKEQKATAKALAKEQEKLQKAMDKAAAKVLKEAEKVRIKVEAKAERERLKVEKKMGVTHRVEVDQTVNLAVPVTIAGSIPAAPTIIQEETCTSTLNTNQQSTPLVSLPQQPASVILSSSQNQHTPPPEMPLPELVILTEEVAKPSASLYETETYVPTFKLPMEG